VTVEALNSEFTRILTHVLHRPAFLAVPAPLVRALFGQMGEEVLLSGARVEPRKLLDSGFAFCFPDLVPMLRDELGLDE